MQPDGIASRRGSPRRNGSHAGANPKLTLQKHQQTLRSCLDLCDSLGFHCEDEASQSQGQTPQQVGQLVDSATQFFATQMEATTREHANSFGKLLDPTVMKTTVSPRMLLLFELLLFASLSRHASVHPNL